MSSLHAAVLDCKQVLKSCDAAFAQILAKFVTYLILHFTLCQSDACMHLSKRGSELCSCSDLAKVRAKFLVSCQAACACLSLTVPLRILFYFRSRGEKESGVAAMEVQSRVGKNVVEDPRDLPPVILMDED